jgi:hypothetical protein
MNAPDGIGNAGTTGTLVARLIAGTTTCRTRLMYLTVPDRVSA